MNIKELDGLTLAQLRTKAKELGMKDYMELRKHELIIEILTVSTEKEGYVFVEGVLEIMKDGTHGVLRTDGVVKSENDIYISGSQIKKFNLKVGDIVAGPALYQRHRSLLGRDHRLWRSHRFWRQIQHCCLVCSV